jgi:hypothetical protein
MPASPDSCNNTCGGNTCFLETICLALDSGGVVRALHCATVTIPADEITGTLQLSLHCLNAIVQKINLLAGLAIAWLR